MGGAPVTRRLHELWRAVFPPKLHVTTQAEREWVAARARIWRFVGLALLVFVTPIIVAALHIFVEPSWMPLELS